MVALRTMERIIELLAILVAGVLLLAALLGLTGLRYESGFRLAFAVLLGYCMLLCALLAIVFARINSTSILRYVAVCGFMAIVSWLVFIGLSASLNVTDSSHGGSLLTVVAGSTGLALASVVLVSRRKRRRAEGQVLH